MAVGRVRPGTAWTGSERNSARPVTVARRRPCGQSELGLHGWGWGTRLGSSGVGERDLWKGEGLEGGAAGPRELGALSVEGQTALRDQCLTQARS